jgi:hypothetical protein
MEKINKIVEAIKKDARFKDDEIKFEGFRDFNQNGIADFGIYKNGKYCASLSVEVSEIEEESVKQFVDGYFKANK